MVKVTKFNNMQGGISEEYKNEGRDGAVLAYVDHNADGTRDVTVFTPYTGRSMTYKGRSAGKAWGIIERHLKREGWDGLTEKFDLTD